MFQHLAHILVSANFSEEVFDLVRPTLKMVAAGASQTLLITHLTEECRSQENHSLDHVFGKRWVIHSAVCLKRVPLTLPKWVLNTARRSVSSFNFQYPLVFIRSSSSCLRLLPLLPVTFFPLSFFSITSFRRQFLHKMCPIQLAFLFLLYVGYSFFSWLCVILPHFSQDRSNWSSPFFFSTTFQNFSGISHPLPEVSKFQHHKMLRSKCSTLLVSSLNFGPVCLWKNLLLLNAVSAISILDLISRVHVASFLPCFPNSSQFQLCLMYHNL